MLRNAAQQALCTMEGSMAFECVTDNFENCFLLAVPKVGSTLPTDKPSLSVKKIHLRKICLFRGVEKLDPLDFTFLEL